MRNSAATRVLDETTIAGEAEGQLKVVLSITLTPESGRFVTIFRKSHGTIAVCPSLYVRIAELQLERVSNGSKRIGAQPAYYSLAAIGFPLKAHADVALKIGVGLRSIDPERQVRRRTMINYRKAFASVVFGTI